MRGLFESLLRAVLDVGYSNSMWNFPPPDRWPDRGCGDSRPARPHLEVFHMGWTAGAGKRAHRIERRSIGEWIRRIIHVTRKDIYESEVSFKRKTGVDFGALTGCEHGNCVAEQRAESNLVLQD